MEMNTNVWQNMFRIEYRSLSKEETTMKDEDKAAFRLNVTYECAKHFTDAHGTRGRRLETFLRKNLSTCLLSRGNGL